MLDLGSWMLVDSATGNRFDQHPTSEKASVNFSGFKNFRATERVPAVADPRVIRLGLKVPF
jgi:hypothetical protein